MDAKRNRFNELKKKYRYGIYYLASVTGPEFCVGAGKHGITVTYNWPDARQRQIKATVEFTHFAKLTYSEARALEALVKEQCAQQTPPVEKYEYGREYYESHADLVKIASETCKHLGIELKPFRAFEKKN